MEAISLLKPRRDGFLFYFQGQSVPWEAPGIVLSSSGALPNTNFLFGPSGVLGSRFGVLGSGFRGVPNFPENSRPLPEWRFQYNTSS